MHLKKQIPAGLTILLLVAFSVFHLVRTGLLSQDVDWIGVARSQELKPCFANQISVNIQYHIYRKQTGISDGEHARLEAAGRIIPEGFHRDIIIPEECFAVASGLGGISLNMWRRPSSGNGRPDMSIPYYTPQPDWHRLPHELEKTPIRG